MTSKKFTQKIFITLIIIMFIQITFVIVSNEFGLFYEENKERRIFSNERMVKNLFTYNYISNNFEGILVGPSLSNIEMNTKKINNYKIYNLSINGGNISEIKLLVDNLLEHNKKDRIKNIIICIDPHLTKDYGRKTSSINKKEYYSTFGSLDLFKYYISKIKALYISKDDQFKDSFWGYTKNSTSLLNFNVEEEVNNRIRKIKENRQQSYLKIDREALLDFQKLIKRIKSDNIQIYGYFYPIYKEIYDLPNVKKEYLKYKELISKEFDSSDVIWDFNIEEYDYIRGEYSTYSDGIHLSEGGASKILEVINEKINNKIKNEK